MSRSLIAVIALSTTSTFSSDIAREVSRKVALSMAEARQSGAAGLGLTSDLAKGTRARAIISMPPPL